MFISYEILGTQKTWKKNFDKLNDWININDLVPNNYIYKKKIKKTGVIGIITENQEITKKG